MLGSAMRTYANRYAVACGKSVVVFTNNDSGYRTARDLKAHGVDVDAIVDSRAASKADARGCRVLFGRMIANVIGGKSVSGVVLTDGTRIECDTVAMSGGWSPIVNLLCHRGAKPRLGRGASPAFLPPPTNGAFVAAGSAAGKMLLSECLADGAAKGAPDGRTSTVPPCRDEAFAITPLWWVKESQGKAFVDYQNDATADDLLLAAREGYTAVELAKRYTTTGMATDQGKLGNVNAIAILAEANRQIDRAGRHDDVPAFLYPGRVRRFGGTVRRPSFPAGAQDAAARMGRRAWRSLRRNRFVAALVVVPARRRGLAGECDPRGAQRAGARRHLRCLHPRQDRRAGQGRGAFLDRLYCNTFSTLTVGRARYGLMLREDGIVFDDGTTSRLADDHFLMTTTTANAARVMSHMEFCHQALWPDLDVTYVSVTEQWAQMAVAGPKSRATLQKIVDGITLDDTTFPYLAAKDVKVLGGIPARLFRISFSGEHAYELAVPADYGSMTAHAIIKAGEEFGIAPYGVEALSIMRIEKGHVAGSELNGTTTAADLGLGQMMSTKKDYIGRMMAAREGLIDKSRQCVVGIRPVDKADRIRAGSHLLNKNDPPSMANDQGYISSVAWSPMLDQWVGLALLANGRERHGEVVKIFDGLRNIHVLGEICEPVHYDRENNKLHA